MELLHPAGARPVAEIIENLVALGGSLYTRLRRGAPYSRCRLQDREAALLDREKALTLRAGCLAERELALKERQDAGRVYLVPVSCILSDGHRPRRVFEDMALYALSDSIRRMGVLEPLVLRPISDTWSKEGDVSHFPAYSDHAEADTDCLRMSERDTGEGYCRTTEAEKGEKKRCPVKKSANFAAPQYRVVCGERRLTAAAAVGHTHVPCILLPSDEGQASTLAVVENLQKDGLSMFDASGAMAALIHMGAMTIDDLSRALSLPVSAIQDKLRLLYFSEDERSAIRSARLTERQAYSLLRITDPGRRCACVTYAVEKGLSAIQTEDYVDRVLFSLGDADGGERGAGISPSPSAGETGMEGTEARGQSKAWTGTGTDEKREAIANLRSDEENDVQNGKQNGAFLGTGHAKTQKQKPVIRDLGLFLNTLDRAVSTMQASGVSVDVSKEARGGSVYIALTIPCGVGTGASGGVSRETK